MLSFSEYLQLGFSHILDPKGYDHILYVLTLCVVFSLRQWKYILGLVTAFTVGHSITLALATLKIVQLPSTLVEALIPLTILVNSIVNTRSNNDLNVNIKFKYVLTVLFGLIHGLGFSNFLRSLLGREESLFTPLLAFNIGLEAGQLIVVLGAITLQYVFIRGMNFPLRSWVLFLSGATAGISFIMLMERLPAIWEGWR